MRAVWKGAFFMIELIKKEIHMNRQRGTAVSQLTLDDDFIVPDALDDAVQILLSDGEVQIENSRIQGEKVLIRGKLVFRVLYRRESGGLQAMGGEIPFEETVNVPELSERDYTQIVWNIEDLNITMIHSRKLSAKAVLTLTVRAESRVDAQAAAQFEGGHAADGQPETRSLRKGVEFEQRNPLFDVGVVAGLLDQQRLDLAAVLLDLHLEFLAELHQERRIHVLKDQP